MVGCRYGVGWDDCIIWAELRIWIARTTVHRLEKSSRPRGALCSDALCDKVYNRGKGEYHSDDSG